MADTSKTLITNSKSQMFKLGTAPWCKNKSRKRQCKGCLLSTLSRSNSNNNTDPNKAETMPSMNNQLMQALHKITTSLPSTLMSAVFSLVTIAAENLMNKQS